MKQAIDGMEDAPGLPGRLCESPEFPRVGPELKPFGPDKPLVSTDVEVAKTTLGSEMRFEIDAAANCRVGA